MKRIGFIGVGEIASAVVEGLCDGVDDTPEILLSPRGALVAGELARRFPSARVCATNQDVVDGCDVVMLGIRTEHAQEVLTSLRVRSDQIVVSMMAGVSTEQIRTLLGADITLVQAIPLQAVRHRASVTITSPANSVVDDLFDRIGGALPVSDTAAFNALIAASATVSTYFAYVGAVVDWAAGKGVPTADADRYLRSLFHGAATALGDDTRSLAQLKIAHETPGGINERVRTAWFDVAAPALGTTLDELNDATD